MNPIKMRSINMIADEIIERLQEEKDPFVSPVLVFHNMKAAQWFKAYFLKTSDRVLMNAEFTTLPVFVNGILNKGEKYTVMDQGLFRNFILEELLDSSLYAYDPVDAKNPLNYFFYKDGTLNGINLYEFAGKLAGLFMSYEMDCVDLDDLVQKKMEFSDFEKKLYDRVIKKAAAKNCYTTKGLFDLKLSFALPEGPVFIVDNSYMTGLFEKVLDKVSETKDINIYRIEEVEAEKEKIRIHSAPSMLREVESLHSYICGKLRDGESLRFNDFLVYAPGISGYANVIRRVFRQNNTSFPSVPFRISGVVKEKHEMADSLAILFDIAEKRYFTRQDFLRFAGNSLIQWIGDFDESDVEAWKAAVFGTNTHRNGQSDQDGANPQNNDWKYLKKRVLLSLLVAEDSSYANIAELEDGNYLPYSAMDLDQDRMNKMIRMVDALLRWCDLFDRDLKDMSMDKGGIEQLREVLAGLYSKPGNDGEEQCGLYRSLSVVLEHFADANLSVPADTLLLLLCDTPNSYSVEPADLFTGGVTFMELAADNIVSAKYICVMGASSNRFPGKEVKSELDLSETHKPKRELDALSIRNIFKNAEQVRISFVDCDLKTEEEFYPSSLLTPFIISPEKEDKIPLDEIRPYAELFTDREFRGKKYAENTGVEYKAPATAVCTRTFEESLSTSDFRDFLAKPLIYKYNKRIKVEEDDSDKLAQEFENLSMKPLDQYSVAKEMVLNPNAKETKEKLRMEKKLSVGDFGELEYQKLSPGVEKVLAEKASGYEALTLEPLNMKTVMGGETVNWTLNCAFNLWRLESGTNLSYMDPISLAKGGMKEDKKLGLYAAALMDVASRDTDLEYEVFLYTGKKKDKDKEGTILMTPLAAREQISELYREMADYDSLRYMDIDFVVKIAHAKPDTKENNIPGSVEDLMGKLEYQNSWKYFADRRRFGVEDLGYENKSFDTDFKAEYKKFLSFIPYIHEKVSF